MWPPSPADAERLATLGVKHFCITGNMKFDVTPPPHMAERGAKLRSYFDHRPVFICGSTREGEETLILDAYARLDLPRALLIITIHNALTKSQRSSNNTSCVMCAVQV